MEEDVQIYKTENGHLCSLSPISDYIRFGHFGDHTQSEMCTPILSIGYPLEKYTHLSVVFREMQRAESKTTLHIFQEKEADGAKSTSLCLTLLHWHNDPSPQAIYDALQGTSKSRYATIEHWYALTAVTHTVMEREGTLQFLQRFLNKGKALVVYLETINGKPPENATLEGKNPVVTFEITLSDLTFSAVA